MAIYTQYDDGTSLTDKTRYLHRDHLGSVDTVTDETGTVTERYAYDPHGKRRLADWQAGTPANPAETPRGFTGHEHLDAVGLIQMNGRVYDPTLGRFLSADPYVQYPETTQGFNRYSYTDNNPLSYTDPSGFSIFNDDGSIAEGPSDSAGPGSDGPDGDDRGLIERIGDAIGRGLRALDNAISDALGVDRKARDLARATGMNYHTVLGQVNAARAAYEATATMIGGEYPPKMAQLAEAVIAAVEKYNVPNHMVAAVAAAAGSLFDSLTKPNSSASSASEGSLTDKPIGIVGGFFDKSTHGPMVQMYEHLRRKTKDMQLAVELEYFSWDEQTRLSEWVDSHAGVVTVIGHSWGADTVATVAAGGHYIDWVVTLDPVGWSRPDYAMVRANTGSWTNINATGGGANFANAVATVGGDWGNGPAGFADRHFEADWLDHVTVVAGSGIF